MSVSDIRCFVLLLPSILPSILPQASSGILHIELELDMEPPTEGEGYDEQGDIEEEDDFTFAIARSEVGAVSCDRPLQ